MVKKFEEILGSGEWILSPYVRVIAGYNKAVVYDFKREKAYQTSRPVGVFLNKVLTKADRVDQESAFKLWTTEREDMLSEQAIAGFKEYIDKLKKLGILVPLEKSVSKEVPISVLECNLSSELPYLCALELTSRCNFHCPHCYLGDKSSPQDLEFDTVCNLLRQIKEAGVQLIHLTGGEIFLRKDLYAILAVAHDIGLEIEIATNGSLLSDNAINVIKRYVKKIQITLYGFNQETYAHFSSDPAVLDKVILNIDKLRRHSPTILELAFTITPYNYQEVDGFYKFSVERGIKSKIGKTLPIGLALREEKALSKPRYSTFLDEVERKYVKKNGPLFRTRACTSDMLTILADGRVVICPLARDLRFTLGNIYRQALKSIWYESAIPYIESLHVDNLKICKACELKYLCGGGCPALWQPLTSKSPPCKIYHTRKYLLKACEF